MQVPLQITFRNTESSEAMEAEIRKRVDKLNRHYSDMVSCRVVVEAPLQHHQKGGLYKVRVDVTCPDGKLEVNRDPDARHHAHKDAYVALRDSFLAIERKLEEHTGRRRKEVKVHEGALYGRITYLSPMENYGTITTPDDREIYFHRNSVLNGNANFDALSLGTAVEFREAEGDQGPQASMVKVME